MKKKRAWSEDALPFWRERRNPKRNKERGRGGWIEGTHTLSGLGTGSTMTRRRPTHLIWSSQGSDSCPFFLFPFSYFIFNGILMK